MMEVGSTVPLQIILLHQSQELSELFAFCHNLNQFTTDVRCISHSTSCFYTAKGCMGVTVFGIVCYIRSVKICNNSNFKGKAC